MFTYYKTYKELSKKINGFEYVDLGLPSGTLWATMNVGASKPSDFGLYFQWGDIQGYTADQVSTGDGQKKFSWDDYKWNASKGFSKYNTTGDALDLEDDAAHANMGGDWHMPTPEQIQELINETTSKGETQNGVYGILFTSKTDPSKSIFIPAAGCVEDRSFSHSGSRVFVWSSMLSTYLADNGQGLCFDSGGAYLYEYRRWEGFSVRGVLG